MCNFGFQPEALNRAFLDIFEELLVLQIFFSCKYPPALGGPFGFAKTVFAVRGGILQSYEGVAVGRKYPCSRPL